MKFKYRPSFDIPYKKQGLIYFTCVNFSNLASDGQHKINNMCLDIGGKYYEPLFLAITTEENIRALAFRYFMDESILWRLCKKFYQKWDKDTQKVKRGRPRKEKN